MKITKLILFNVLFISVLTSCGVTREYDSAKSSRSITQYVKYLEKYPESKFTNQAKVELSVLIEERDWLAVSSANTVYGYKDFINRNPNSIYAKQAELKIKEISENEAWIKTKALNTMFAYENFMASFPDSKYSFDCKNIIQQIKEDNAWNDADFTGNLDSYNQYLADYPNGSKRLIALERIRDLRELKPLWEKVLSENSVSSYRKFIDQYPASSYSLIAKRILNELETEFWNGALKGKSIGLYKKYIENFPEGKHIVDAEKAIIDLEVDNIFKGSYGKLPPLSKLTYNYNSVINDIEIFNNTIYTLTVRYSGSDLSKKIVIPSKKTMTLRIRNGNYRVAASVDAKNVTNYAGEEKLDGGSYASEFYIVTKRY